MTNIKNMRIYRRLCMLLIISGTAIGVAACGGSSSSAPTVSPPAPPPPPTTEMTVSGVVTDGPVFGGTLFVFAAADVLAALDGIDPDGDRLAELSAASNKIATLTRNSADEDQYDIVVPAEYANSVVFLIFDGTNAEDDTFKDTPANLESVVMLGAAGSVQRVNISIQTTMIAYLVRAALDPDGDGTIIGDAAIQTAIDDAIANVLSAFATDSLGRDLYPADFNPFDHDDDDEVHAASTTLGFLLRSAASVEGASFDEIVAALASDAADGVIDGVIPVSLAPTPELEALAAAVSDIASAGSDDEFSMFAVGACSSAAVSLRRACAVDVVDDLFEGTAICTDIFDDADRADCLVDVEADVADIEDECGEVFDARLALCENVGDAAHDPMFGEAYAANFVDPLEIGSVAVPVNPWFPLVTGNHWLYLGDGESIDVTVTDETKLIDGVTCVVVLDVASEDGVVVEITEDWYAQDTAGNVWYCGEIARNFEVFPGDDPETPEVVDIEGSWKAGRDGAEPGILLPFDPQVGDFFRQEVLYGEAEDAIEILSITADEAAPGGVCASNCLLTADFTPLEPGVEENKYYVAGIGLIVEINPDTGERVELDTFTPAP